MSGKDSKSHHGVHLIIDMWEVENIDEAKIIEIATSAASRTNSTIVHTHLHRFPSSEGISYFALLAESHISIHTWPEHDYVSADVYTCADGDISSARDVFLSGFNPKRTSIRRVERGHCPESDRYAVDTSKPYDLPNC